MAQRPGEAFAAQLQNVRKAHGWSLRELSRRLEQIDVHLTHVLLQRIEAGERDVSLDEALALAATLGIAPLHAMVPTTAGAEVQLAARLTVTASAARKWVRGRQPLPGSDQDRQHAFARFVSDEEHAAKTRWLEAMAEWSNAEGRLAAAERNGRAETVIEEMRVEVRGARKAAEQAEQAYQEVS